MSGDCEKCGNHSLECCCEENKTIYQDLKDKDLIGFFNPTCHIYGCRNLETRCKDCGRLVNTAHYDSQWISVEILLPGNHEKVLVSDGQSIACGFYVMPGFFGYLEGIKEVTHWMPLPTTPGPLCRHQQNDLEGCQDDNHNQNDNQVDR